MRKFLTTMLLLGLLLVSRQAYAISDWSFSTIPFDGAVSGTPGATIGWGYSLSNPDTSNWLVISGISAGSFLFATPDDSIFNFPILAPSSSIWIPYDGSNGLYQITYDLAAPVGLVNIGAFTLTAEFYDGDPLAGGNFVDYGADHFAYYSAEVVSANPVPEPGTFLLLSAGMLGFFDVRRRIRK